MDSYHPTDFTPLPRDITSNGIMHVEPQRLYAVVDSSSGSSMSLAEQDPHSTHYEPDSFTEDSTATRQTETTGAVSYSHETGQEICQPEAPLTSKQAKELGLLLAADGYEILSEPPQATHAAERNKLASAQTLVSAYLTHVADAPNDAAAAISENLHTFEAAAAGSLSEVRSKLDKYDHFHPDEDEERRSIRKKEVIEGWVDIGILREHKLRDVQLAPEVSRPECAPPANFRPQIMEARPFEVTYDDRTQAVADLVAYNAQVSPDPQDWDKVISQEDAAQVAAHVVSGEDIKLTAGTFFITNNEAGGCTIRTARFIAEHGVPAMERFAHVVDQTVEYPPNYKVTFKCPTSATSTQAHIPIPFGEITSALAAATGRPEIASGTPDDSRPLRFNLPDGGHISFDGGNIINLRTGPYSQYDEGEFDEQGRLPFTQYHFNLGPYPGKLAVELHLGPNTTAEERRVVADRLSAWMSVWAGDQPRQRRVES